MIPRRAASFVALLAILAVASCKPKPPVLPAAVPGVSPFVDYVYPAPPADLAGEDVAAHQRAAWASLQAADIKTADREFAAILKRTPTFYPAEAGLGYTALARKDAQGAVSHFDKALASNAGYAPALSGKGDALLAQGKSDAALQAFRAALSADPSLTGLTNRVAALQFRGEQQQVAAARKAADAGQFDQARRGYQAAIAASPQSAFLYRELAIVDGKAGDRASALIHAQQAVQLDPTDVTALTLIAETYEADHDWAHAIEAYSAVNAADPSEATAAKIEDLRSTAAFESMPQEYRAIAETPAVTRGQLAALIGIRLGDVLRRVRPAAVPVVTDTRGNWAATWIVAVTRAGVMEVFPNHTFQPSAAVRRADLAAAASRLLSVIAADNPRLAARWRDPRPKFSDLAPTHLSYPAAARAVSAGIMAPFPDGSFQLARPVSGADAIDAVTKLAALAKK